MICRTFLKMFEHQYFSVISKIFQIVEQFFEQLNHFSNNLIIFSITKKKHHISKTKNQKIDFSFVSKHNASSRIIKSKTALFKGRSEDRNLGQGHFFQSNTWNNFPIIPKKYSKHLDALFCALHVPRTRVLYLSKGCQTAESLGPLGMMGDRLYASPGSILSVVLEGFECG